MDTRFPPPSDSDLKAVLLCMQAVCETAKIAKESLDDAGLRVAWAQRKYLDQAFDAMLERQRGATVH
jgi:hypothetical protein